MSRAESGTVDRAGGGGRLRMPRSRGAVSGVLLLILGAWGALAPFIGPYFHFAYTPRPGSEWHWTAARGWFEVLPGAVTLVCGLLLLAGTNRLVTSIAAWLAAVAGGWFVVGPSVSLLLTLGSPGQPSASGDRKYVAEQLAFFLGLGVLIAVIAGLAVGRLSMRSARDERRAAARTADDRADTTDRDAWDDAAAEQFRREPAPATDDRPVVLEPPAGTGEHHAGAWGAGAVAAAGAGYGTVEALSHRDSGDSGDSGDPALADDAADRPSGDTTTELPAQASGVPDPNGRTAEMPVADEAERTEELPPADPAARTTEVPADDRTAELPATDEADRTDELPPADPAARTTEVPADERTAELPATDEADRTTELPPADPAARTTEVPAEDASSTPEPAQGHDPDGEPAEQPGASATDQRTGTWNPDQQSPITTGELPRLDDESAPTESEPTASEPTESAPRADTDAPDRTGATGDPSDADPSDPAARRTFALPRRYEATAGGRSAVRQDEVMEQDLDTEMDLDERRSR